MSEVVPLRRVPLERWLASRSRYVPGTIKVRRREALGGGVASAVVDRVSLTVTRDDGGSEEFEVVVKRASAGEVVAMREIASVAEAEVFPELVDAGCDDAGPWLVMPFYPGSHLSWDVELPAAIYADLARLHLRYLGRARQLPDSVPRVDSEFCRRALVESGPAGIYRAHRVSPHPVHQRVLRTLGRWLSDARIYQALDVLPATLLHGDVYGHNVVVSAERGVALAG